MRLAILLFFALSLPAFADEPVPMITVSGEGRIAATPDMAELTIGVAREARRPDDALDGVAEGAAAVLALLDEAGIAPADRRTSALSLQPRWDHSSSGAPPRIAGYVATNQITVRVRDLSRLGALISGSVGDGANRLSALNFVVADPAPLEREARRLAVLDAMEKAALYADTAGVTLGDLMSVSDGGMAAPGPGPVMAEMAMRSDAMPVAEGEVEVRATVTMVYAIGE